MAVTINHVLIGGAGFVGSRLESELSNCIVLDKRLGGSNFIDITLPHSLISKLNLSDSIILLAAEHRDDVSPVSKYYDDYLCWWNLLEKGKGKFLNKPLTTYVENEGSVSSNKFKSAIETWKTKRNFMNMGIFVAFITTFTYLFFGILKVKGKYESIN